MRNSVPVCYVLQILTHTLSESYNFNINEGMSRGQCNGKAKRGREKSLDPRMSLITQLLLSYLSVFRGRYVPVWAMAGMGTPANLNI